MEITVNRTNMKHSNNGLLLVAYYYPPNNNGGTARPMAFRKFLSNYEFNITVATTENEGRIQGECNILRLPSLEWTMHTSGKKWWIIRKIRGLLHLLGIIINDFPFWTREVVKEVLAAEVKPIAVISTYPPIANMIVGYKISTILGIPLVLDFRDGFCVNSLKKAFGLQKWRNLWLEKRIVSRAELVITVADSLTTYYRNLSSNGNVITIPNGFDSEMLASITPDKSIYVDGKINFVFTGRLSKSRKTVKADSLIDAVDRLHKDEKEQIIFHMIGEFSDEEMRMFNMDNRSSIFKTMGKVSQVQSLSYQAGADYLLQINDLSKDAISGKVYEYIGIGRPILALSKGTVAGDIIEKTGTGICVSANDPDEIMNALREIIHSFPKLIKSHKPNLLEICKYSRKEQMKILANHLHELLEKDVFNETH